jgi:hypothetical protein
MLLKQKKSITAVCLLAACTLFTLTGIAQTKTAPAPPTQPVLVTNGAGQPVPTTAQGTTTVAGTVNIGNTPSVSVANMPSVNVSNTPSVNVANTPAVTLAGGASVAVTSPLDGQGNPTQLAVLDAVQPYEDTCIINFAGGDQGFCSFQQIPSGKRLVIQEFDALGQVEIGVKPAYLEMVVATKPHFFPATFIGTFRNAWDNFVTHQETRMYGISTLGAAPSCFVNLSTSSNLGWVCSFSGFLVDVP